MNKDKSIKDLKKRNDSLKMQYEYRNIRCITLEKRIERYEQQINNLNKFIKEYGNYLDSLHLDNQGIVYRVREKWSLLLKGIVDNE